MSNFCLKNLAVVLQPRCLICRTGCVPERSQMFPTQSWSNNKFGRPTRSRTVKMFLDVQNKWTSKNGGEPFVLYFWFCTGGAHIKNSKGRKIARIAPISAIFGPNESSRHNLFFEKFRKNEMHENISKNSKTLRKILMWCSLLTKST